MNNWPRYETYHLHELEESLIKINEEERPEEANYIRELIEKGGYKFPSEEYGSEENTTIRVEGIGGWLILPIIGLFLTPIISSFQLINVVLPSFEATTWAALTTQGSPAYHPVWAPYLIYGLIATIILIISAIALLIILFKKLSILPSLIIVYFIFILATALVDNTIYYTVILDAFPQLGASMQSELTQQLIRALIGTTIWVPYFIKSERVKNTFVN